MKILKDFKRNKYGPIQMFSEYDILRTIWRLDRKKGRARLCSELGIGEGSTRTILLYLKVQKAINETYRGHELTEKGVKIRDSLKRTVKGIRYFDGNQLTYGKEGVGAVIRKSFQDFSQIREAMNIAVRQGSYGSTFLICCNGRISLIGLDSKTNKKFQKELFYFREMFSPEENETVVLCYGENIFAERAIWAIAYG